MKTKKSDKKVPIKKVRIRDVIGDARMLLDKNGKPYRAVKTGNNHHIEIFEYMDKKGRLKRDGKVITLFDAVQRSQRGEPVVKKDYDEGKKFVCSLAINEMFMLESDDSSADLYRIQKISQNNQIYLQPHAYGGDLKKNPPISKMPNQLRGHKVTIDPLGRIYPAND
jgi:hypothetical protein